MFRVVLFAFSLIFFLTSNAALAQESVRVRGGDHDDYARLVFDWGRRVNYSVATPAPNQLVINFNEGATLDDSAFRADPPKNISSLKVLSTAPLKVSVTLAEGATTRDFSAETRVIIDVYDPPGAPKVAEKKPEPKPAPKAQEKPPAKVAEKKPEPVKPAAPKVAAKETPIKKPVEAPKSAAAPVADVAKQEIPKKEPEKLAVAPAPAPVVPKDGATPLEMARAKRSSFRAPQAPQPVGPEDLKKLQQETQSVANMEKKAEEKPAVPPKPNIISLTATKSTGIAIFERDKKIWMITDQEDTILNPSVSGPNAKEMMPPGTLQIEGGKLYTFPKLPNIKGIQGQAGGLSWRIVLAPHDIHLTPILPTREDSNGDDDAGGSLIWDMKEPSRIIDVVDPVTGRKLKVVTVNSSKYLSGPGRDFMELATINTQVGLVILPKVDDLTVEITRRGVVVTRPGGLRFMPESITSNVMSLRATESPKTAESRVPEKRIFDFNTWQMGGMQVLERNRNLVLSTLAGKKQPEKIEGLLSLARMHLANGLWAEASGFLDFAVEELPELATTAEYMGLRGATRALGRVSDLAFEDLNEKQLNDYPEINYWKAYALADLEDWQQAGEILPKSIDILAYYPEILISRLGLVLAEVALRSGKLEEGERILRLVQEHGGHLVFQQEAALSYLKGEAARQRGKPDEALTFWQPLTTGKDAMYRTRAGLAITRLQYEKKKITSKQAIDNLERLRYAWRGDELEALINYWLGKTYFDTGDSIKGLRIMRDGAEFSEGTDLGERITAEMTETFITLFSGDGLLKLSGPDAAALYDEFAPLVPAGDKANLISEKLADHLVDKQLLERATRLMQVQLTHMKGAEAYRIATKLAAIELLDNKSVKALSTIGKAKEIYEALPVELKTPERFQELSLLRARALSQERRPDQALALLEDLPRSKSANKLRSDIAWKAGYWDDAGAALGDVIADEDISLTRPLSAEHTNLLMQRAVALSLASDRMGLANMREKYSDSMAQTDKARVFEVITRPRQSGALADRETLMGVVSEVDMFKEFLNSYKAQHPPTAAAPPAAATPAVPAAAGAATPPATPPATAPATAPATSPPAQ